MQSFKSEKTGHTYLVSLSYGRCEKIKAKTGIDILEGEANQIFMEMWTKPKTRMDVLWEMIDEKAELPALPDPDFDPDLHGETPDILNYRDSFQSIMEGQTLIAAGDAFWDELCFFFQSLAPERAAFLKQMVAEMKELSVQQAKAAEELGNSLEKKKIMSDAIEKAKVTSLKQFEKESGLLLESLASTPGPTATGNST